MVTCSAFGCANRSARKSIKQIKEEESKKINFFKFPKNIELRNQWIKATSRDKWVPNERSFLCSNHFTDDVLDKTSVSCVRLRVNAVPTIFSTHSKPSGVVEKYRKPSNKSRSLNTSGKKVYDLIESECGSQFFTTPLIYSNEKQIRSLSSSSIKPLLSSSSSPTINKLVSKNTSFSSLRKMHQVNIIRR